MTAWVPTIKSVNEPLAPCFTVTTSPVSINEPGARQRSRHRFGYRESGSPIDEFDANAPDRRR